MISPKHSPAFRQTLSIAPFFVPSFVLIVPFVLVTSLWVIPLAQGQVLPSDPAFCAVPLPQVEWLGEGTNTYLLGPDFDTFIVKQRPFAFALEPGSLDSRGEIIYRAGRNERVWRCRGNCDTIALDQEPYLLGTVAAGTTFHLVVIDDDGPIQSDDQRYNWWAVDDPMVPHTVLEEQAMVEYLSFTAPTAGTWYYYTKDSMGIVADCLMTAVPTPTVTPTLPTVATATPTPSSLPTATATAATTPTAPPTSVPTATSMPTVAPTPIASSTPVGNSNNRIIYVGSHESGVVDGVVYENEDILLYDTATGRWALYFDGSDVDLTVDISAFHLETDGTVLLSPFIPTTLPDVGAVDRGDILRFTPSSMGEVTAGTFSWVLDGSDVGFNLVGETIDAIARIADGRLVISTYGSIAVPELSASSWDLVVFNATTLGQESSGSWELYFDGDDVGFTGHSENINGLWIDNETDHIYLTTFHDYTVKSIDSLNGDSNDIFVCAPESLGTDTACRFSLFWDGDLYDHPMMVDTLSLGDTLPNLTGGGKREVIVEDEPTNLIYIPFIGR